MTTPRILIYHLTHSVFSPLIFLIFIWCLDGPNGSEFFGVAAMSSEGTNVRRLNLPLFFAFSLGAHLSWLGANYSLIRVLKPKITWEVFTQIRLTSFGLLPGLLGVLNLFGWAQGMEGNVFAFLFFLPLLLASVFEIVIFFVQQFDLAKWKPKAASPPLNDH